MGIWRLTINPAAEDGIDPRKFCLENNILGVGWRVDQDAPIDWDTYCNLGNEKYFEEGDNG